MLSVVYAAGIVLAVTLAVLAVDWPKVRRRFRRPPFPGDLTITFGRGWRVTHGIGWHIATDHRLEVSSTQVYPNGTTQIWLKRKPAA